MDVSGGSSNWLDGKKVLLTGATGYLGKVICEKLLRECLGIRRLYILVRANEKEDLQQRLTKFKEDVIFDRVKSLDRGIMNKVIPIEGDLSAINLDLQDFDRDTLKSEVNIVIHAGCNSDLYVGFKEAILTNVRGTKCILQLAESMTRLESFIYVSHVFSNCDERIIEERIYPAYFDPNDLIRIVEERKEFGIEAKILNTFCSFYLFSHHLAETLISKSLIPSAITRLSTLTPPLDEPFPGWIEKSNHLDNLLMFAGNGSIQSLYGKREAPVDILPVDLAAKGVIAIAQKRVSDLSNRCMVYNLTDAGTGEILWGDLMDTNRKIAIENPLESMHYYPGATIYSNFFTYLSAFVLYQIIPAILYDVVSFLCTGKIRFVKAQLELFHQLKKVNRFFQKAWMFDTENADEVFTNLSFTEKLKFKFRTQNFNLEEYVRSWNYGRRTYLLQLENKASRVAKWKVQGFKFLGFIFKTITILFVGHELLKMIGCEHYMIVSSNLGHSSCCRCSQVRSHLFSTFQKI